MPGEDPGGRFRHARSVHHFQQSCGIETYGWINGSAQPETALIAGPEGELLLTKDRMAHFGFRERADSPHGVLTVDCLIVDREGSRILRVDPFHPRENDDATGEPRKRIARLHIELLEMGFTDSAGQ